ncbi:MAG TPA: alpha-amylase family glycosyl hydrolase [Candidatus Limnocylindrales bacterium]|nr:alpha-amylase family glycosyl hydrolase [Candidatus Limnocylindrales bacterium]
MRALPISRTARRRFALDATAVPPAARTSRLAADVAAARRVAAAVNATRTPGQATAQAGELAALELLHEIFHLVVAKAAELVPASAMPDTTVALERALGPEVVTGLLDEVATEFPDVQERPAPARLEELLLIRVANENPAARPLRDLVDDTPLLPPGRDAAVGAVERYQATLPVVGPNGETLVELLRAPARAHPTSLTGQLKYVRDHWGELLGDALDELLDRLLLTMDVIAEEERGLHLRFGGGGDGGAGAGGGRGEAPDLTGLELEPERFSSDSAWMPRLVLIAKSTHVWLDQLSRRYGRDIRTLDAIPDEELDRLARWGITGLWLIGLWQRSKASQRIKVWRGNPDAAASAYSLDDYVIAWDLGGEDAWANLRHRAWQRGIRLASDMVPNHMGLDSRWVIEHPEWFLATPEPPYPAYTFNGENLAEHDRVEVRLEDHYWDNSDAAVVFERRDRWSGERRYIYHGNDGTSFPWNDTAQLDFSQAVVREQVIQAILAVARRFPVIRFDAAMVLAKRHVRRLWFPGPGEGGGGIPSRAEHGTMTEAEFDAAMPQEFWREVVDRVAAEVPDTLLLAEAFWMLEGYFVRTLGMHRVYNSAFMHMLRDEDNAGYRRVLKETLEFDPEILKRYVNFMNNPDEKTAVEQFGKGDKYIGVATLLATLPGLPMFGHGQFEGFAEKYGMEFRRATLQEPVDEWLIARHEREVVPLLHRRADFAEAHDFLLYDFAHDAGGVDENVFAYSNGSGPSRSLVVFHNRYAETSGWIRDSAAYAVKEGDGSKRLVRRTIADGLGLDEGPAGDRWLVVREQRSGLEHLRSVAELRERGLHVHLRAYETKVFWEMRELHDTSGVWRRLAERLGGRGVPSLEDALRELQLAPLHDALRAVIDDPSRPTVERFVAAVADATGTAGDVAGTVERVAASARASMPVVETIEDPSQQAALRLWALLGPLGSLAAGAPVGRTSRAWIEELRLAPVIADALRARGLDEAAAWWAAERVRLLVDLPLASSPGDGGAAGDADAPALAARLGEAWLDHPVVRTFLRVNAWDGVEWFHRESWDELVAWHDRLERVTTPADERAVAPLARALVERRLLAAGAASGYRVDGLRAALVARPDEPGTGPARLPNATGLPRGPLDAAAGDADAGPDTRAGEAAADVGAVGAQPTADAGSGQASEPDEDRQPG